MLDHIEGKKKDEILEVFLGERGIFKIDSVLRERKEDLVREVKRLEAQKVKLTEQQAACELHLAISRTSLKNFDDFQETTHQLIVSSGVDSLAPQTFVTKEAGVLVERAELAVLDEDAQAHLDKGLCLYIDPKNKRCQKKLKTKEEKANRHCDGHWKALLEGRSPKLKAAQKKETEKV